MGELYNPYPKLPKNIRQIGDRDLILKLYVEDYVNTYLKRLYPVGGQDLLAGLLVGEVRNQDGVPYLFVDGALEMEGVTQEGEKVEFTEAAWKAAYQTMEQMFPKRTVLGWFLCGVPGCSLSPLNYWKHHGQYFSGKNQLMYLNCGLEGEEAIYMASEDGFYKLRGYYIYYERNQMMQDYMVSRKDARRVESGTRDAVIRDFRQKMEDNKAVARRNRSMVGTLGTACGVLSVMVLACGVVMFNNYSKMQAMESVIVSALPEGTAGEWSSLLSKGGEELDEGTVLFEEIPGEVYPTQAKLDAAQGDSAEQGGLMTADSTSDMFLGRGMPAGSSSATGDLSAGGSQAGNSSAGSPGVGSANAASGAESEEMPQSDANSAGTVSSDAAAASAIAVEIPADAVAYVVQPGESLYGICMERYQSSAYIQEICLWNGLADENYVKAGQEIYLPPVEEDN